MRESWDGVGGGSLGRLPEGWGGAESRAMQGREEVMRAIEMEEGAREGRESKGEMELREVGRE